MDIKYGISSNLINFIRPYPIINYFIRKTKNLPQKGFKDKKQRPQNWGGLTIVIMIIVGKRGSWNTTYAPKPQISAFSKSN